MKMSDSIVAISVVIAIIIGYSFFSYQNRSKALDAVASFKAKNHLIQVSSFKEMNFNLFDWVLTDKSDCCFVFLDSTSLRKIEPNNGYYIQFSSWKEPGNLKTLANYSLERNGNKFTIVYNNLFWIPVSKDSLEVSKIKNTIFQSVDNWVQSKSL